MLSRDVEQRETYLGAKGTTALHAAVQAKAWDRSWLLVERGARVQAKDAVRWG